MSTYRVPATSNDAANATSGAELTLVDTAVVSGGAQSIAARYDRVKVVLRHDENVSLRLDYKRGFEDAYTEGVAPVAFSSSAAEVISTHVFDVLAYPFYRVVAVIGGTDQGVWGASASAVRAEDFPSTSTGGDPPAPSTVSFAVPGSDLFAFDLFHLRRGLVGGTLSRCWIAFTVGGVNRVYSFQHNGSRADASAHVPALSTFTHTFVDLGGSANSTAQVASALISAAAGDGVTISTDGTDAFGRTILVVTGGSSLVVPATVDMTDASLRGMFGVQRDAWSNAQDGNQNGGTGGTGSVHMVSPGASESRTGRVLGSYLWAHSGYAPRLAVATGPAQSGTTPPGALIVLAEDEVLAGITGVSPVEGFGGCRFLDSPEIADDDNLWMLYKEDTAGGPRFRFFGETVEGNGEIPTDQRLLWDTTSDPDESIPFGSTYSPPVDQDFGIYIAIGLIVELQDDNGNYPADGSLAVRVGDQNTDVTHGSPFLAGPGILDGETTHHFMNMPQWTNVTCTEITRGVEENTTGEDCNVVFYLREDDDIPSTGTHTRMSAQNELMGIDGLSDQIVSHTLVAPVDLGTEVIGADAIVTLGFNYVVDGGGTLTTLTLPVFLSSAGFWDSAGWTGDGGTRTLWHDDMQEASGGFARPPGETEYRTRVSAGNTGMPTDAYTDNWPSPFVTDPSDDSPNAIAIDSQLWVRLGMTAVV